MARPLRIEYENAFYHVMNRGRGRQTTFPGRWFFEDFLKCIDQAHKRFGIEVHAYCLMPNHYHLLVNTPRGNLSRAMRHIDGVYTQCHNRRKETDGPLFRGRYKAILIEASAYLLQVSRYIHRNPIEMENPLVRRMEHYPWSSFSAYLSDGAAPDWLIRRITYAELGCGDQREAYKTFVERGNDRETEKLFRQAPSPVILGGKAFQKSVFAQVRAMGPEVNRQGLRRPLPLTDIIQRVADFYGLALGDILVARRGRGRKNVPRWVAMKMCQEIGSARLSEIGEMFHVSHYSTVSQTIGRLDRLLRDDPRTAAEFNVLSQDLTP